jgi:hypothetical protein
MGIESPTTCKVVGKWAISWMLSTNGLLEIRE